MRGSHTMRMNETLCKLMIDHPATLGTETTMFANTLMGMIQKCCKDNLVRPSHKCMNAHDPISLQVKSKLSVAERAMTDDTEGDAERETAAGTVQNTATPPPLPENMAASGFTSPDLAEPAASPMADAPAFAAPALDLPNATLDDPPRQLSPPMTAHDLSLQASNESLITDAS